MQPPGIEATPTKRMNRHQAEYLAHVFMQEPPVPAALQPFKDRMGAPAYPLLYREGLKSLRAVLSADERQKLAEKKPENNTRKKGNIMPAGFFMLLAEAILVAAGEVPRSARQRVELFAIKHIAELGLLGGGTKEAQLARLKQERSKARRKIRRLHAREQGPAVPQEACWYEILALYGDQFPWLQRVVTEEDDRLRKG